MARTKAQGEDPATHDSFLVSMDGEEPFRWNLLNVGRGEYRWSLVDAAKQAYPRRFDLKKGPAPPGDPLPRTARPPRRRPHLQRALPAGGRVMGGMVIPKGDHVSAMARQDMVIPMNRGLTMPPVRQRRGRMPARRAGWETSEREQR